MHSISVSKSSPLESKSGISDKWMPLGAAVSMSGKSLVPYRQCSAARTSRAPKLLVRSTTDTAICSKPLAR
jgi:hypothetical protein